MKKPSTAIDPNFAMNIFERDEVARDYDRFYRSEKGRHIDRLEKAAMDELIRNVPPGLLLEIGCGTGHWSSYFAARGFRVVGIDPSRPMLAIATGKNLEDVDLIEADVRRLPFADGRFDQVAAVAALEFCGAIDRAFAEMTRVLRHGGCLITGCLNADSPLGKTRERDPVLKHGHFMSRRELRDRLAQIGDPTILDSVYLSTDDEVLDRTDRRDSVDAAFLAAAVRKS